MHEAAVGHDTQKSWPVGTRGFGLGVIDQPPAGALAGAAEAPIRMVAAAVARQATARHATARAATFQARCGRTPDCRGRRFPEGLIGCCPDGAAARPVTEMTPRMMAPKCADAAVGSPTLGTSQKAHIAGQAPFRQLSARTRAWLTMPEDVIGYRLLGPLEVAVDGPPSTWAA